MIVTLTARRLRSGAEDEFRAAFEGAVDAMPEDVVKRWSRVFVCRDVRDPDVILTFGLFDGTLDELRAIQGQPERDAQLDAISPTVDEVLLDGSYEVIREITP
jgi:hypothetical protein